MTKQEEQEEADDETRGHAVSGQAGACEGENAGNIGDSRFEEWGIGPGESCHSAVSNGVLIIGQVIAV